MKTSVKWGPKQWKLRRRGLDYLNFWASSGYDVLWVTLTSAPGSSSVLLRKHFELLRRAACNKWGYDRIEFFCVQTSEGHGVLHLFLAVKCGYGKFYLPFAWLSEKWKQFHGAEQVYVARVRRGGGDRRRLTNYVVAQYCGGQDAVVRVSGSRSLRPFGLMRKSLYKVGQNLRNGNALFAALGGKYYHWRLCGPPDPMGEVKTFGRLCREFWSIQVRRAWEELVASGECSFLGSRYVWWCGSLSVV